MLLGVPLNNGQRCGVTVDGQIRGCHRCRPQSRLEVTSCLLMWMASMVLLCMYIVCLHLLPCGSFPVYLVLCLPCMHCNTILCAIPLDCSSVLTQVFLQCSSSFSDVYTAQSIWYTTLFSSMHTVVCTRASQRVPLELKVVLIPSGLHTRSILSLIPMMYVVDM